MTTLFLYLALGCFGGGDEDEVMEAPAEDPEHPLPELQLGPTSPRARPAGGGKTKKGVIEDAMCDDLVDGGPVNGPGCVTAEIKCGESIVGHTLGGTENFDTKFYEKKFCTPALTNHDGGDERVYLLSMPEGDWTAEVTLETPCADLDLAAFTYDGDKDCPDITDSVPRCEMWPKPKKQEEHVRLVSQRPTKWWIVVEGKKDAEGAFALHVDCGNHL